MGKAADQSTWVSRARRVLPGGGFGNFDPAMVMARGVGSHIWDQDGNEYIDLLIGSGPMLLGHSHPEVLAAVAEQLPLGQTFFANNPAGIELAERICATVPSAEQLRYVTSGGEADMYAIRLARAFTGRDMVLKFEGGYHGMSAEAQMSLAPGASQPSDFPHPIPDSAGIPASTANGVLVAPFNDPAYLDRLLADNGHQIACIIVEPIQRIVPPEPGFLGHLRAQCDRYGIVLIFDEIVTGYRLALGGAQTHYGVVPDLCTLGKVIGGGFPLAAVAGRADILAHFDKSLVGADNWLMQLGTLSGNPVAAVAGLKTLDILERDGQYAELRRKGAAIWRSMDQALSQQGIGHQMVGDETLFEVVFTDKPPTNYRDVQAGDSKQAALWNNALRAHGIFKSPGKVYPSLALTSDDLEQIDQAAQIAARAVASG